MNKKDQETLTEAGGVPAREIYPSHAEFTLPDSGQKVTMRKMMVSDSIDALRDPLANHEIYVESMLVTISLLCTFDGQKVNWGKLKSDLSLVDYNYIVRQYSAMTEPGKEQPSS